MTGVPSTATASGGRSSSAPTPPRWAVLPHDRRVYYIVHTEYFFDRFGSAVFLFWYQLHSRTNDCNGSSYQRAVFRPHVLHHYASVRRMGPDQHVTLLRSRCVQDEADLQAFRHTVYPRMRGVPHSLFDECERFDSAFDYVPHGTCGTCMARSPSHCHTYRWCTPCAFVGSSHPL